MQSPYAQLLFLAGPQAGRRGVLRGQAAVIGRTPKAEVPLADEFASREQARLDLTRDGWLMTNLSSNGTRVNGRKYKSPRKQVLLGSGDVLEAGLETRILFVAAGDDAEKVLAEYVSSHPAEPPSAATPQSVIMESEPMPAPAAAADEPVKTLRVKTPAARRDKLRKYAVFFGVYLAALAGLVAVLSAMRQGPSAVAAVSTTLSDEQIAEIFTGVVEHNPIPTRAAAELREAVSLYDNLPAREGDLYHCVRSFQQYLSYKQVAAFDEVGDERKYQDALERLVAELQRKYRTAWALEKSEDWRRAKAGYDELLRLVPEERRDSRVYQEFVRNIIAHAAYVQDKAKASRRR